MRIAFLGTRGVPARYGGFETAVEEIGSRLAALGEDVVVYCRNEGQLEESYRGMRLVNLPALRRRSLETLSHTALSVLHLARHRADVAFVFNAGNAPLLPLLQALRVPTAVHVDGLEWQRAKWAGWGARYYRWAERFAAGRRGMALIADAEGIADHLRREYGRESELLAYGAPVLRPGSDRLAEHGLLPRRYHLVVARFEPENHVEEIVAGFAGVESAWPLVVVGDAPYADEYRARIRESARGADVRFLGSVWDQDLLDELYGNALSYLHGHSVGGTNPSLLRALGCGAPVSAWDVSFNREVTDGHARFFADPSQAGAAILADESDPDGALARGEEGRRHVEVSYVWDDVAEGYRNLAARLAARR